MRMNNETKITFALEHIAHLEDLIKDNIDEAILQAYLNDIKVKSRSKTKYWYLSHAS